MLVDGDFGVLDVDDLDAVGEIGGFHEIVHPT